MYFVSLILPPLGTINKKAATPIQRVYCNYLIWPKILPAAPVRFNLGTFPVSKLLHTLFLDKFLSPCSKNLLKSLWFIDRRLRLSYFFDDSKDFCSRQCSQGLCHCHHHNLSETSDGNYVFCYKQLNLKLSSVEFGSTDVIWKEIVQSTFIKKLGKFDLSRPILIYSIYW